MVLDVENGSRFETYVIRGEPGTRVIGLNGPCSKLSGLGHRVIILTFAYVDAKVADDHRATVVLCTADNAVAEVHKLDSRLASPVER